MLSTLNHEIIAASLETLYMVVLSTLGATLLGWPLGTLLYTFSNLEPTPLIAKTLSAIINITRSIPFIIFMVALLPFTRWLLGSAIGIHAAIVALTLGATPLFARLIVQAYEQIPLGIIEYAHTIGATSPTIIYRMLFQETRPLFIDAITMTAITLVGYSAMAGAIGGGGLGDLAIRYGYQRFDTKTMFVTICILVILVQCLQWGGIKLRQKIQREELS